MDNNLLAAVIVAEYKVSAGDLQSAFEHNDIPFTEENIRKLIEEKAYFQRSFNNVMNMLLYEMGTMNDFIANIEDYMDFVVDGNGQQQLIPQKGEN